MDDFDIKLNKIKNKAGEVYETAATVTDVVVMAAAAVPIYAAYKVGEGVVKGVKAFGNWLGKR